MKKELKKCIKCVNCTYFASVCFLLMSIYFLFKLQMHTVSKLFCSRNIGCNMPCQIVILSDCKFHRHCTSNNPSLPF